MNHLERPKIILFSSRPGKTSFTKPIEPDTNKINTNNQVNEARTLMVSNVGNNRNVSDSSEDSSESIYEIGYAAGTIERHDGAKVVCKTYYE